MMVLARNILNMTCISLYKMHTILMVPKPIISTASLCITLSLRSISRKVDVLWQNVVHLHSIQVRIHFPAENLFIGRTPRLCSRLNYLHVHQDGIKLWTPLLFQVISNLILILMSQDSFVQEVVVRVTSHIVKIRQPSMLQ